MPDLPACLKYLKAALFNKYCVRNKIIEIICETIIGAIFLVRM